MVYWKYLRKLENLKRYQMQIQYRNRIAAEMHETAKDMYSLSAISKAEMREFDLRCTASTPCYSAEMIRDLRDRLQLTQAAMAMLLNTSLSTVQKWEIGAKKPGGPSCKLLQLLDNKGLEALLC